MIFFITLFARINRCGAWVIDAKTPDFLQDCKTHSLDYKLHSRIVSDLVRADGPFDRAHTKKLYTQWWGKWMHDVNELQNKRLEPQDSPLITSAIEHVVSHRNEYANDLNASLSELETSMLCAIFPDTHP